MGSSGRQRREPEATAPAAILTSVHWRNSSDIAMEAAKMPRESNIRALAVVQCQPQVPTLPSNHQSDSQGARSVVSALPKTTAAL